MLSLLQLLSLFNVKRLKIESWANFMENCLCTHKFFYYNIRYFIHRISMGCSTFTIDYFYEPKDIPFVTMSLEIVGLLQR